MHYTDEQLKTLREAGRRLAKVMREVTDAIEVGTTTRDIEDHTRRLISDLGDRPAFLGYQPTGAPRPFPAASCTSINEEIVHGIPNERDYTLQSGDIITVDIGLMHEGMVADMAHTVVVGESSEMERLRDVALAARKKAIAAATVGNTTGDIGHAVQTFVQGEGFNVPRELGGHGVGHRVHDEPFVPNVGEPGTGVELTPGMVLAIEPIVIAGNPAIELLPDGYTYVTKDSSPSAQFEHTVLITESEPEILTVAE